jgi:glycerol-3-phosphate cytidylyltransferase
MTLHKNGMKQKLTYKRKKMPNIVIIGAGAFGTAIGKVLCENKENEVTLLTNSIKQCEEINKSSTNKLYYRGVRLPDKMNCTVYKDILKKADIIFIALPSSIIPSYIKSIKYLLLDSALVVNLSKGLFSKGKTVIDVIREEVENEVVTLKGGTFAIEVMNAQASMMTLGYRRQEDAELITKIFKGTNIYFDYSTDILGVEYLSVVKNIYAILLGIIDAQFNSINTRFMVFTKSFQEISLILKTLNARSETLHLNCGIGDFALTSLNDLSRNRTLGLLIGKNFYQKGNGDNSVILEGRNAINYVSELLPYNIFKELTLLNELKTFFLNDGQSEFNLDFNLLMNNKPKTVLTYGTFDLLHYGHLEILRRSKELGVRLVVGISTDEFNLVKGKTTVLPYLKRKQLLEALEYVDLVIPEENWEQKINDVKTHNVDLFVMGDDWKGEFDFLKEHCEVLYLSRTDGISTTKLKKVMKKIN